MRESQCFLDLLKVWLHRFNNQSISLWKPPSFQRNQMLLSELMMYKSL